MSKPFSVHIPDSYTQERFNVLSDREGYNKQGGGKVYGCSSAVPTGGYGFALIVKGPQKWGIREDLQKDLQSVGADLSNNDEENLKEIARMHNDKVPLSDIKKTIAKQHYDLTLDKQQSRKIFDRVSDRKYEGELKNRLKHPKKKKDKKPRAGMSDDQIKRIQGTREWVALYSTVYRGTVIVTPSIIDALIAGNRQETWFAMKYDTAMAYSEPKRNEGIFNRSTKDANYFGLYDDPANPTDEEAQNLIEVYKKYTDKIKAYDMAGHKDPFLPYLEKAVQQLKTHGKDPGITLYALPKHTTPTKKRTPRKPTPIPKKNPVKKTSTPSVYPEVNQLYKTLVKWETYVTQKIRERWW